MSGDRINYNSFELLDLFDIKEKLKNFTDIRIEKRK